MSNHDPRSDPKPSQPPDHRDNPSESIGVGDVVPDRSPEGDADLEPPLDGDMDHPAMDPVPD